jgi:hypothetical protein
MITKTTDVLYKEESYQIMGACFNVYNDKGNGFLEAVYQDCMEIELELKAVEHLAKEHLAQVFNYLKATGLKLGIIVNFGHYPDLEYKRIVV